VLRDALNVSQKARACGRSCFCLVGPQPTNQQSRPPCSPTSPSPCPQDNTPLPNRPEHMGSPCTISTADQPKLDTHGGSNPVSNPAATTPAMADPPRAAAKACFNYVAVALSPFDRPWTCLLLVHHLRLSPRDPSEDTGAGWMAGRASTSMAPVLPGTRLLWHSPTTHGPVRCAATLLVGRSTRLPSSSRNGIETPLRWLHTDFLPPTVIVGLQRRDPSSAPLTRPATCDRKRCSALTGTYAADRPPVGIGARTQATLCTVSKRHTSSSAWRRTHLRLTPPSWPASQVKPRFARPVFQKPELASLPGRLKSTEGALRCTRRDRKPVEKDH
jgi:hypothetical protein